MRLSLRKPGRLPVPLKPSHLEGAVPTQPHFALMMDDSGTRLAIPPGASLWLVEDASQMDKIFPLVLKKVSLKKIVFELRQPDGKVTEYTYQLTTAKPLSKGALHKVLENRNGAAVKFQK